MNKQAIALLSLGALSDRLLPGDRADPGAIPREPAAILVRQGGQPRFCDQRDLVGRATSLRPACRPGGVILALAA